MSDARSLWLGFRVWCSKVEGWGVESRASVGPIHVLHGRIGQVSAPYRMDHSELSPKPESGRQPEAETAILLSLGFH